MHNKIKSGEYTHYWLKGGRGSTKSSFASIEIILGMMKDSDANAVVIRKMAAQPYLRPALQNSREAVLAAVKAAMGL